MDHNSPSQPVWGVRTITSGSNTDSVSLSERTKAQAWTWTIKRLVSKRPQVKAKAVWLGSVGMTVAMKVYYSKTQKRKAKVDIHFMEDWLRLSKERDNLLTYNLKISRFQTKTGILFSTEGVY